MNASDTSADLRSDVRNLLEQERCLVREMRPKNQSAWLSAIDALDAVNAWISGGFTEEDERVFSAARDRLDIERIRGGYASHRVFEIVSSGRFPKGKASSCGFKKVSA